MGIRDISIMGIFVLQYLVVNDIFYRNYSRYEKPSLLRMSVKVKRYVGLRIRVFKRALCHKEVEQLP